MISLVVYCSTCKRAVTRGTFCHCPHSRQARPMPLAAKQARPCGRMSMGTESFSGTSSEPNHHATGRRSNLILQATDEDAQIIQLIGVPLGGHSNAFSVAFGGKADIPFCTMSALTQS